MINFDTNFILFIVTTLMVNLSPGAAMLFVFKQSKSLGIKSGIMSAMGVEFGVFIYVIIVSLGIGSLIIANKMLFEILQVIGAIYLVYLAYSSWPKKNDSRSAVKESVIISKKIYASSFIQGVMINLTNPKIIIFFISFFPQFIDADFNNGGWNIFIYGIIFNLGGVFVNLSVALFANRFNQTINRFNLLNYIVPILFLLISFSIFINFI